ncbi:MAG: Wzz/FepE/Etk N-terminal domain-containing protein [Candidatus Eisenbacteria bacterium]|nr:Wzz/FepE/Etk N-terminal domain-containing protein [Candidatus Eisenbacteria bacterium]
MSETDLLQYVGILSRWKRFLIGTILATAIVSAVVSFFLPKYYAARATILPPQSSEIGASLSSLLQGITLPGIGNVGPTGSESQLFLAILDSRTLRTRLIEDFGLKALYKSRTMDDALKAHRTLARAGLTDQGAVEIIVEDRDPKRAADEANAWVRLLDDFNKNSRMTSAGKNREFVEGRLDETRRRLADAEDLVAVYQKSNKSVPLTADIEQAVDSGASLMAQRIALLVRLNRYTDIYRADAPQVQQARADLAALDREIELMPPLAMEFARLLRNLKIEEHVFTLLTAQYEEARIQEVKDTPTLQILDLAVPPERRSRPIRWLFCASLTGAAVVLSFGVVFTVEFMRRLGFPGRSG